MFTGIIEAVGTVQDITSQGTNKSFYIKSSISSELGIDESISHNGVCLTVEEIKDDIYKVTAIKETLDKTNNGAWKGGDFINLERSMKMGGRLDGHIVQGHVDCTAKCISKKDLEGSYEFTFEFDEKFAGLVIEKGSISLNGISLTIFNVGIQNFSVAIIPYTFEHTNMKSLQKGMQVNIEFDMIGKYVSRLQSLR